MSIWQNFKETDHSFEKKFFGIIFLFAVTIAMIFLIDIGFDQIPDVKRLLANNTKNIGVFFFSAMVVLFFTSVIYLKTLDTFEAETNGSINASIYGVVVWTIYWVCWSVYWAWIDYQFKPLTSVVLAAVLVLVIAPGFAAFIFSRKIRHDIIKDEEKDRKMMGENYDKHEPYVRCTDKKYFSGYYGLICLPVFLFALLIFKLFG